MSSQPINADVSVMALGHTTFESCYYYLQKQQEITSEAAATGLDPTQQLLECISREFDLENEKITEDMNRWLLVLSGVSHEL